MNATQRPLRHALRATAGALVLLLTGCDDDHHHHSRDVPPEEALGWSLVDRDPNHSNPKRWEREELADYDDSLYQLTLVTGVNPDYHDFVDWVADHVGIDPNVFIEVADDFRFSSRLEYLGGGITGDQLILLDGKLLDILLECSSFFALLEFDQVDRDYVDAIDEIGLLHNDVLGATTGGFLYPFTELDDDVAALAEQYFFDYVCALLSHEFGHVFYYHALENLREFGHLHVPEEPQLWQEEDGDLVSGMLSRKASSQLIFVVETFDVLAYYATQRFDRDFTYHTVLSDWYQFEPQDDRWPAPAVRKLYLTEGYERFEEWWGL